MVGRFPGAELHVHDPVNAELLDLLQATCPQMLPQLMIYCKIYFTLLQLRVRLCCRESKSENDIASNFLFTSSIRYELYENLIIPHPVYQI